MTTITIPASDLENKFASDGGFTVQSIDWSIHCGDPTFSISVNEDYIFDTDEYIKIEQYEELKDELEELKEEFKNLRADYLVWLNNYDTLEADFNRFKDMTKRKSFSWKFWK